MTKYALFLLAFVTLRGTSREFPAAAANVAPQPTPPGVSALRWMAGCWEQRTGTRVVQEQWMAPAGGAMLGMSRTLVGDRMREWESVRIVPDSGRLSYMAQPNGRPATAFRASVVSDTLAVFENATNDFPQRISYRRLSADSIVARISADRNGKTQTMDFRMQRAACGA